MKNQKFIIFLILLMGTLAPIAVDEYAPSMPAMVHALGSSVKLIQLTIPIFLLAMGIGQVILGPLSDHFGRKKILQLGTIVFLGGTLLCIFSANSTLILIGRAIQGFGIASAALTTTALIGDFFEGKMIQKVTGYFVLAYGLVPILAPVIGGYIQDGIGWRANFVLMFLIVLIAGILNWIGLPEKKQLNRKPLSMGALKSAYRAIFTSPKYVFAVSGAMLSWSTIITFSIIGPFLVQNVLGFSATIYGYAALSIGLGFFLGNILNARLIGYLSENTLIRIGIFTAILSSLILLGMVLFYRFNIWTVMAPSFFVMIGIGFCFPNYYGKAVSVFTKQYVGTANALIGALVLFGTVIYSLMLITLHVHSPITLGSVYLILSLLNYFVFILVSLKK